MSDLIDRLQDMVDFKHDDMDVAREAIEEIVKLEAQHDEQAATIARLRAERNAEISARMKAEGEFSTMQRRIARQRRALAKLYQRRHDKNAALATARREGMETIAEKIAGWHEAQATEYEAQARKFEKLKKISDFTSAKPAPDGFQYAVRYAEGAAEHRQRAAAIRAAASGRG